MKIEIKHRFTAAVLFEHDAEDNSMRLTLRLAIEKKIDLRGADLSDADLRDADLSDADLRGAILRDVDLRGADLSGADLSDADLRGAILRDADLRGADLRGADLSDADLRGADLSDAILSGADLRGADLSDADLRGAILRGAILRDADLRDANLRGADLSDADLRPTKADFIEIISQAPREVPALIDALRTGRVDGSTYSGECACLVGTIAHARGLEVDSLQFDIPTDSSRPAESFFMAICKGDTPETNPASKLALEWAETWLKTQRKAFAQ